MKGETEKAPGGEDIKKKAFWHAELPRCTQKKLGIASLGLKYFTNRDLEFWVLESKAKTNFHTKPQSTQRKKS